MQPETNAINTTVCMSLSKPFKRTIRPFTNQAKEKGGWWHYIENPQYCESPEHYIRAFFIILKDFINLLDFIEPADKNLSTYSFRVHELLSRTCVEIEANLVAILTENGYSKSEDWDMRDYKKVDASHRLSEYEVKFPVWKGEQNIRKPFEAWKDNSALPWWKAYTKTKHKRHFEFEQATFSSLTDAICGLVALLHSQFEGIEFSYKDRLVFIGGGPDDGMISSTGDYFRIKPPENWNEEEKYDFDWSEIEKEEHPFECYDYS